MSADTDATKGTRTRVVMTAFAVALAFGATQATPAAADDSPYPSASAEPPVEVDTSDSDLKLPDGATLAPPKVLDIKSVIEDLGGEERREDTNADIKFALQAEVLFGKDSAKLSGEAKGRIDAIAEEIKRQDARKVRVFGFTDNLGSSEHGDVLSKKRAEAVHNVLDEALGGTGITFEIRGYGEDYPIASNDDEEGRRKNRRVEVSFQRGESGSQS
ncbi:outer membrane protein OmpA-like peptidoglycan-associated protein [Streptomyces sp. KhCrAH-43]|uniref:OmpA family protein n=2 Tax=Streptomyces TaxID=1883 RepID=UPI00036BD718|nr:OmpA family protein [Streptomyces sp. SID4920]MYX66461.1 OmpA family protein [Streptomyces sp. SID8373]RAJ67952.1 outer membrane protein OmpA-like peptidoglycan-associated protein [Streptomyces sp. KhCrAH-43]